MSRAIDYYIQTIANLVKAQGDMADLVEQKDAEIALLRSEIARLKQSECAEPAGSTATWDQHGQATP